MLCRPRLKKQCSHPKPGPPSCGCPQASLLSPTPTRPQAAAREEDLRQRVAVAQLEVRKLRAALEAKRRRAAEAQRKLQALLP